MRLHATLYIKKTWFTYLKSNDLLCLTWSNWFRSSSISFCRLFSFRLWFARTSLKLTSFSPAMLLIPSSFSFKLAMVLVKSTSSLSLEANCQKFYWPSNLFDKYCRNLKSTPGVSLFGTQSLHFVPPWSSHLELLCLKCLSKKNLCWKSCKILIVIWYSPVFQSLISAPAPGLNVLFLTQFFQVCQP